MTASPRAFVLLAATALVLAASLAHAQAAAVPDMLVISQWTQEDMADLVARDKFGPDPDTGYPGVAAGLVARRLERAMNASLQVLLSVAEETRSRAAVLERVRGFLLTARGLELPAAENERILWCYEQACEILRVVVERDQLEAWLHGPAGRP
jgi:hypothetical protein